MARSRCGVATATAVAIWVAMGSTAFAVPGHGEGQADAEQLPSGGDVTVIVAAGGGGGGIPTGPGPETAGGTSASQGLIYYYWEPTGLPCWYGTVSGEVVDGSTAGEIYEVTRVDYTTDPPRVNVMGAECFDPANAPATTPPPPPPPTIAEMSALARALIIVPDVQLSPDESVGGVTGLETWFWYDGQDEVTATASIRGYSVTATMRPSRYYWDPDDPRGSVLESPHPGSEEDPAARWIYETKGNYVIRIQVVWDGTWSFSGFGASASGDLPTIRATGASDYRVDEVRSELTGTR